MPGRIVAAPAHGDLQIVDAREVKGRRHISRPVHFAITAGRRSTSALKQIRAASYPGSLGLSTGPASERRNSTRSLSTLLLAEGATVSLDLEATTHESISDRGRSAATSDGGDDADIRAELSIDSWSGESIELV
jgi:hypothetical protein